MKKQIRKKLIFVLFLYSYRVLLYMRSLMPFDFMTWICYIVYLKRYFSYLIAANLGPSQTRFKLIYMSLPQTHFNFNPNMFFFSHL